MLALLGLLLRDPQEHLESQIINEHCSKGLLKLYRLYKHCPKSSCNIQVIKSVHRLDLCFKVSSKHLQAHVSLH